jgi:hypothetical protein
MKVRLLLPEESFHPEVCRYIPPLKELGFALSSVKLGICDRLKPL